MAYISAARGFKSGGWSPRPTNGNEGLNPFDPEFLWSYEIGAKTTWFDNRLQLNLAGFYNDYTDIQITTIASVGASLILNVENAGEAEIYGFEIEALALPTEHLELNFGAGYLHNEYTDIKAGATIPINAKLTDTPDLTLNLGAQYTYGLGQWGTLTLRGDGAFRGKTFKDPFNIPELTQKSYWLVNSRITYTSPGEHWQVALYGKNLTDEEYLTTGLHEDLVGALEGYYGRPREWGVSVRYRY
jgi:iron complex outermembrane receptor protein